MSQLQADHKLGLGTSAAHVIETCWKLYCNAHFVRDSISMPSARGIGAGSADIGHSLRCSLLVFFEWHVQGQELRTTNGSPRSILALQRESRTKARRRSAAERLQSSQLVTDYHTDSSQSATYTLTLHGRFSNGHEDMIERCRRDCSNKYLKAYRWFKYLIAGDHLARLWIG